MDGYDISKDGDISLLAFGVDFLELVPKSADFSYRRRKLEERFKYESGLVDRLYSFFLSN